MRILVKGKLKETPIKCKDCDTIYTYNRDDIESDDRLPTSFKLRFVLCPTCGRKHFLK